jgi:hypothetical protein
MDMANDKHFDKGQQDRSKSRKDDWTDMWTGSSNKYNPPKPKASKGSYDKGWKNNH